MADEVKPVVQLPTFLSDIFNSPAFRHLLSTLVTLALVYASAKLGVPLIPPATPIVITAAP